MLPNFVIIGAQKAATTSLWLYLKQHPEVFMSPVKETDFFIAEMGWRRGREWYETLFAPAERLGAPAVGEASPNYTLHPSLGGVPERMASVIPEAKLIYVLRHPVDRMISSYVHSLTKGMETLPIERALLEHPHYADISRYSMQLEQYLRCFDRDRILLLLCEDLETAPAQTLERTLAFLGVRADWRPPDLGTRHHRSAGKRVPRWWWRRLGGLVVSGRLPVFPVPPGLASSSLATRPLRITDTTLPPGLRERLEELLRPDVARLREYLGKDFDGWGLLN